MVAPCNSVSLWAGKQRHLLDRNTNYYTVYAIDKARLVGSRDVILIQYMPPSKTSLQVLTANHDACLTLC